MYSVNVPCRSSSANVWVRGDQPELAQTIINILQDMTGALSDTGADVASGPFLQARVTLLRRYSSIDHILAIGMTVHA